MGPTVDPGTGPLAGAYVFEEPGKLGMLEFCRFQRADEDGIACLPLVTPMNPLSRESLRNSANSSRQILI